MQVIVKSRHPVVKLYLGDVEVDQQPWFVFLFFFKLRITFTKLDLEITAKKPRVNASLETNKVGGYALLKTHPCHNGITEHV